MLKIRLLLIALLSSAVVISQLNMDSISNLNLPEIHNQQLNDIWGYVDEFGNEYALVGGTEGTSVVDLSDPTNPIEVFYEPGMSSTWRDLKTVGDYAYVTTEAQNGLLIIDLSPLPSSTTLPVTYYNGPVGSAWSSAHNLYADSTGYVYIFGANRGNGGVIILDVSIDPMNPVEVGVFDDWYVHDGYVENDTMYLGHISDGFFSIVDIQVPSTPVLLGTRETPSNFSHNIWTSGGQYAFTTDEVSNGYIGAYDISDPMNITELDRIQSSPGANVVPHNTHVLGNYIITSYYSDGVTVHDVTHPNNMIEVANYDTYPTQTEGYEGCWGAYPYLPSGLILATDREYGLFVLDPDYQQAAYLEGVITNSVTSSPIVLVDVQIVGHNQLDQSNISGAYATGIATGGVYDVTYSKIGYYSQTIQVTIANGSVSIQDVQLVPIPPFNLEVTVLEANTNNPIDGADIWLDGSLLNNFGVTNALGEENFVLYYEELYRVSVGKWGYLTHCESLNIDSTTGSLTIWLIPGIYDDFTFDYGWTSSGSATSGLFERGVPNGTPAMTNPGVDSDSDCNDLCFVTGNADTDDFNADDVDDGDAELRSPIIDLSAYNDPYVSYERWYYCDYGVLPPGDSLEVFLSNGLTSVRIDVQTYDQSANSQWIEKTIRILDYIDLTSTMQFNFRISDFMPDVNITEAGVDHFFIVESEFVATADEAPTKVSVYPNPSETTINIGGLTATCYFELISIGGRSVKQGLVSPNDTAIDVASIQNGVYFLRLGKQMQKIIISH